MSSRVTALAGGEQDIEAGGPDFSSPASGTFGRGPDVTSLNEELHRLRAVNRVLGISLGAFSSFLASRGLLEDAWHHVHRLHLLDEEKG